VEEKSFQEANPNGGSFTNPLAGVPVPGNGRQPTVEEQAFQKTYPNGGSFPNVSPIATNATPADVVTGTTPTAASGLPGRASGQFSDADWEKNWLGQGQGYVDAYNSHDNALANYQRGDTKVAPGVEYMAAHGDPDAMRVVAARQAAPDFYNSQNAADWALGHNASLVQQAQAGGGAPQTGGQGFNGGLGRAPQQASPGGPDLAWLRSQVVNEVKNPVDNAHALLSDQMRQSIVDSLASLGATNFKMGIDNYGNMALTYTSKSGTPETIKASLVDYANALDTLKQRVAAQTPATPAGGGGGGYAPRGYAPRGGGSGGYTPPAAQTPPANPYAAQVGAYDTSVTPTTGIRGPDNGPGAVFGTNLAGNTVGGPYSNQTAPLTDEFGQPYGRRYGQTGIR
jgi:hypothetical protein